MKYRVIIPLPQKTEYLLDSEYPEKAKRDAAKLHRKLMPNVSIAEIALMASCYKVHPDSNGGRYKSPTFIESAYRAYFHTTIK